MWTNQYVTAANPLKQNIRFIAVEWKSETKHQLFLFIILYMGNHTCLFLFFFFFGCFVSRERKKHVLYDVSC
jgi:hypothetical protein